MSAPERPFTKEDVRAAVWVITDRVKWGLENELGTGNAFVAHDAEGVVLVAAAGDYGDQLRLLLAEWDARPQHLGRPLNPAREKERS